MPTQKIMLIMVRMMFLLVIRDEIAFIIQLTMHEINCENAGKNISDNTANNTAPIVILQNMKYTTKHGIAIIEW